LIIKACKVSTPGTSGKTFEDGATVILDYNKVVSMNATLGDLHARSFSSDFRTDASIKKRGDMSYLQGRDLQGVSDAWLDPSMSTGLLDGPAATANLSLNSNNNNKDWDQFETNRVLFNVRSTYDENLYTKKLDYDSLTPEQIARAERIAKEIEKQGSSNIHLLEERGHVLERDIDEEALYSGVIRSDYQVSLSVSGGNSNPSSGKESGNWRQPSNKAPTEDKWQRGVPQQGKNTPKNQSKDTLPPSQIVSPAAAAAAINPLELPAGLSPTNRNTNNNALANFNPPKGQPGDLQGPPQLKFGTVDSQLSTGGHGKVIIPTTSAAHLHSVTVESTTIASFNNLSLEKTTTTTTTTTDATTKPIPGLVHHGAAVEIHKTTALEESHSTTLFDAQGKAIAGTKETVTTTVSEDRTLTKTLSSSSSSKLNINAKSWTPTLPPPPVSLPSSSSASISSPMVPPSPVAAAAPPAAPVTPVAPVVASQPPPMVVAAHTPVAVPPPHPQLHTPSYQAPPSSHHTPSSHSNASHGHHGSSSHGHSNAHSSHANSNSNTNAHAHHVNSPHVQHPSTPSSSIPVTPVLQPPVSSGGHGNYESPSMSRINSSNAIRNSPQIQALSSPAMTGSPSTLPPNMSAASQQIPSMTIPPQSPYGASPVAPQYIDPNAYYQQQAQQYVYRAQENGVAVPNSFFYDPYTSPYNYYATAGGYGYPMTATAGYPQAAAGYPQVAGYAMDPNMAMYSQMAAPQAYAQPGAYAYAQTAHMGQPMMQAQGGVPGMGVPGGQGQGPRK
jgi:hypothetical protein